MSKERMKPKTNYAKHRHIKKEKKLFAFIMKVYGFDTDQQLAEFILSSTTAISAIRNDHRYMSASLILRIYDKTTLSIEDIRKMAKEDV